MAWKLADVIEPKFDGGVIRNKYVKAGLFVFKTKELRNSEIKTLYRELDAETTTLCFVSADNAIYELISNPSTEGTTDQDWKRLDFGVSDILTALGTWDSDNTTPVLKDTDAVANGNTFYIVTGAPTPVMVQYDTPGEEMFGGAEVTVKNGDWIISNGTIWFVSESPLDWDDIANKPTTIDDYVAGNVIAHQHAIDGANGVSGLQTALDLKYDLSSVGDHGTAFGSLPDAKLMDVYLAKTNFYQKSETYSQTEIDNLVGTPLTTKGDLMGHNGTISTRVGIAADGMVLTADVASASGFKWATPADSGWGLGGVSTLTTAFTTIVGSTINHSLSLVDHVSTAGFFIKSAGSAIEGATAMGGSSAAIVSDPNNVYAQGAGLYVIDYRAGGSQEGLIYAGNYWVDFVPRSLTDKDYDDNHIGGQLVDALVVTPTASEDGFVIAWNYTNDEYELVAGGGGSYWALSGTSNLTANTVITTAGGVSTYLALQNDNASGVIGITDGNGTGLNQGAVYMYANSVDPYGLYLDPDNLFGLGGGAVFKDYNSGTTVGGIKYGDDYSLDFTDRSLIDRGFGNTNYWRLGDVNTQISDFSIEASRTYGLEFGLTAGFNELTHFLVNVENPSGGASDGIKFRTASNSFQENAEMYLKNGLISMSASPNLGTESGISIGGGVTLSTYNYAIKLNVQNAGVDFLEATDVGTGVVIPVTARGYWTFNPRSTVNAGLNVGVAAADPSVGVNGDVFYDNVANKFRGYENGAWANLIGGGGWTITTQDGLAGAGQNLTYTIERTTSNTATQFTAQELNFDIEQDAGGTATAWQLQTGWGSAGAVAGAERGQIFERIMVGGTLAQVRAVTASATGYTQSLAGGTVGAVNAINWSTAKIEVVLNGTNTFESQSDYSANFIDRSFVTKGYIEGGFAGKLDRVALNLTTGDVATPVEGQIWYNDTTNKFRAFENAAAVDMIGGGGGAYWNDSGTTTLGATTNINLPGSASTLTIGDSTGGTTFAFAVGENGSTQGYLAMGHFTDSGIYGLMFDPDDVSGLGANNGAVFYDNRTTTQGLEYLADYSAGFTTNSLINKGFADGAYWRTDADTTLDGSNRTVTNAAKLIFDMDGVGSAGGRVLVTLDPFAGTSTGQFKIDMSNGGIGETGDFVIDTGGSGGGDILTMWSAGYGAAYNSEPGSYLALTLIPKQYADNGFWKITGLTATTGTFSTITGNNYTSSLNFGEWDDIVLTAGASATDYVGLSMTESTGVTSQIYDTSGSGGVYQVTHTQRGGGVQADQSGIKTTIGMWDDTSIQLNAARTEWTWDVAATATRKMRYEIYFDNTKIITASEGEDAFKSHLSNAEVGGEELTSPYGSSTAGVGVLRLNDVTTAPSGGTLGSGGLLYVSGTSLNFFDDAGTITDLTAAGGGNVTKVGTPVVDQLGVWTGDGTLEGDVELTFNNGSKTLRISAATTRTQVGPGMMTTYASNVKKFEVAQSGQVSLTSVTGLAASDNNFALVGVEPVTYGTGTPDGVMYINNATTAPTGDPTTGGGVLYASGNNLYWRGNGGGGAVQIDEIVSGTGTDNYVAMWDGTGAIQDSFMYDSSGAGNTLMYIKGTGSSQLVIENEGTAGVTQLGLHATNVAIPTDVAITYSITYASVASWVHGVDTSADSFVLGVGTSPSNAVDGFTITSAGLFSLANGLVLDDNTTQEIHTVSLQLTQGQIQALNTTPIEIVAAPASGKYLQVISASAYYNHNATSYSGGTLIRVKAGSNVQAETGGSFINSGSNRIELLGEPSTALITMAAALDIEADADSTGAGGTIDVYVQYVIIDTN